MVYPSNLRWNGGLSGILNGLLSRHPLTREALAGR